MMLTVIAALIVDDQDDVRFLVRTILESSDAGVVVAGEAASGQEALALLAQGEPDVALIDVVIPPGADLEVARQVRERHPDVPVVLFSAHVDSELRESAAQLGIATCVAKSDVASIPAVLVGVARP
jgi:DNA-binding NarL/FixJ family response regulator